MARRRPVIFDTENFHFGQVPRQIGRTLLMLLVYMLLTFTLAVLVYLAFTLVFRTDTERRLRREIRMYERLYPGLEERGELLGDAIANLQHKDNEIYGLVFHTSGAPMMDPVEEQGAYRKLDTIPEYRLTDYTRDKADSLLRLTCAYSQEKHTYYKKSFHQFFLTFFFSLSIAFSRLSVGSMMLYSAQKSGSSKYSTLS